MKMGAGKRRTRGTNDRLLSDRVVVGVDLRLAAGFLAGVSEP